MESALLKLQLWSVTKFCFIKISKVMLTLEHKFINLFVITKQATTTDAFITLMLLLLWCFYYCKTSSITIWFVLAAGLAESLTQVVFRQPFVIQHVRTRFVSCETWNFLLCIFFSSPYNQLVIFDVIAFLLAAFVLFRDLSHKNAWLKHTIPETSTRLGLPGSGL